MWPCRVERLNEHRRSAITIGHVIDPDGIFAEFPIRFCTCRVRPRRFSGEDRRVTTTLISSTSCRRTPSAWALWWFDDSVAVLGEVHVLKRRQMNAIDTSHGRFFYRSELISRRVDSIWFCRFEFARAVLGDERSRCHAPHIEFCTFPIHRGDFSSPKQKKDEDIFSQGSKRSEEKRNAMHFKGLDEVAFQMTSFKKNAMQTERSSSR